MKNKMALIAFYALLVSQICSLPALASPRCAAFFDRDMAELSHLEAVNSMEFLDFSESRFFIQTATQHQIQKAELYLRYSALLRYSRSERNLSVAHVPLIDLAVVTLEKNVPVENVTRTIDSLLMNINPQSANGRRLKISNTLHIRLAEAIFRFDLSLSEAEATYNLIFTEVVSQPPNPLALLSQPSELALQQTLQRLMHKE